MLCSIVVAVVRELKIGVEIEQTCATAVLILVLKTTLSQQKTRRNDHVSLCIFALTVSTYIILLGIISLIGF